MEMLLAALLLLLVFLKFGTNERISLRIESEGKSGKSAAPDCAHSSFFIEHLRPFEGRMLRHALDDVYSVDECTSRCAQMPECAGANFLLTIRGDPLCSLHSAEPDTANQSPLVVIFGITRFCHPSPIGRCPRPRPWAFQKFHRIGPNNEKFLLATTNLTDAPTTLANCLWECQKNRDCASAIYFGIKKKCRLASISPQNVHGLRNYFHPDPDWDIYESNCLTEPIDPSQCGFSRINQAGFVEPFSILLLQIRSPDECQKACLATLLSTKTSICRSWTHDSATGRCFLSHLALRGLGRNVLEQMGPSLSSGELDECMNFRLDCRPGSLLLIGHSPLKLFRGHVRSKRVQGCQKAIAETHHFVVDLPFGECGFEKRSDHSHWGTFLVKEGSTELITSRDKMVQANCRIHRKFITEQGEEADDDDERPSSSLPSLLKIRLRQKNETGKGGEGQQQSVATRVIVLPSARERTQQNGGPTRNGGGGGGQPQYRLEVLDAWGRPAQRVEMGERGFLEIRRVDARKESDQMGLTLTDLRAIDNEDPEGKWVQLIDQNGCVANSAIVLSVHQMDPNRLRVAIKFSGFQDKAKVSYQGLVKRCQYGCELDCGRRREKPAKKEEKEEGGEEEEEENSLPIRLHRRAIPSPSRPNRHFLLSDDLYEVQSRSAFFTAPSAEKVTPIPSTPINPVLVCLQGSNCISTILLAALQAFLCILCLYLIFWNLRNWLRNIQLTSLLFMRNFYAKMAQFRTELDGQGEEDEEGEEEGGEGGANNGEELLAERMRR